MANETATLPTEVSALMQNHLLSWKFELSFWGSLIMDQIKALCLNNLPQLSRNLGIRMYWKYWEGGKVNSSDN